MKLKIAYDCRHLQKPNLDDGASRYSFELLSELAAGGQVEMIYLGYREPLSGTVLGELARKGGEFAGLYKRRRSTAANYALAQFLFPRAISGRGVEVFHALFQTEALVLTATPQVITVHDLGPYYSYTAAERQEIERAAGMRIRNRLQDAARLRFIRKAKVVMADSEFTRRRLTETGFAGSANVTVVYPGLKAPAIADEAARAGLFLGHGVKSPYILMVGRVQPYKNLLGAIRAFKIVTEKGWFSGQLLVAGVAKTPDEKAYLQECVQLANSCGLSKKVLFLGYVADPELNALYSGASVFLQPSFLEGFGFPPLEASAHDVPVVISSMGSLPEVAPQAFKVSPFSPEDIAEGVGKALKAVSCPHGEWNNWRIAANETLRLYGIAHDGHQDGHK